MDQLIYLALAMDQLIYLALAMDQLIYLPWPWIRWSALLWQWISWSNLPWQYIRWSTLLWQCISWSTLPWQYISWSTLLWPWSLRRPCRGWRSTPCTPPAGCWHSPGRWSGNKGYFGGVNAAAAYICLSMVILIYGVWWFQSWKPKKDKVRKYIPGDICPQSVLCPHNIWRGIYVFFIQTLCGHILQGYMSALYPSPVFSSEIIKLHKWE